MLLVVDQRKKVDEGGGEYNEIFDFIGGSVFGRFAGRGSALVQPEA